MDFKAEADKIQAITAWDDGKVISILGKKDGKRIVTNIPGYPWYFAIKKSDEHKGNVQGILDYYYQRGVVTKLVDYKDEWLKIYCDLAAGPDMKYKTGTRSTHKELIQELKREGVVLFESDLSLWKRFVVDNFVEVAGDLDILYFDIETDDTKGGIVIGRDEILSWAAVNNKGEIHYYDGEPDESLFRGEMPENREKRLLMQLLNLIHAHDMICGWNSSNFDLPYIQERMKKHGLTFDWKKKIHIDMMQRCAKVYSYNMFNIGLKGFALNEVARVFLGESKVAHEQGIKEMFDHNRALLKEYNIKDVTLLLDLDKKLLLTDLMIKECQWTGAFLNRFYIGELLDNYILRRTRELGFFQYSRPEWKEVQDQEETKIRGGYVMSPITGLYDNVRVMDFKSLYPSIIVGFNIGKDSLDTDLSDEGFVAFCTFLNVGSENERKIEDVPFKEWWDFLKSEKARLDPDNTHIQTANNVFYKREVSFIGDLVSDLLDKRAAWKAQAKGMDKNSGEYISIQQSQGMVKEMANSMFGITGDKSSRYFHKHVAEGITLTGQFMNRISSWFCEQRGYKTIYGDTDSIFLPVDSDEAMDQLVIDVNADLRNWLDNDIGVIKNIVELQYEKKFAKMVMLDKKRYTGHMTVYDGEPVDKLFTRGLENIKNNTIVLAREAMVELIESVVKGDISKEAARTWMTTLRNRVLTEEVDPSDILIMTRISKPPASYASKQPHVRLAERLINSGQMMAVDEKSSWGTRMYYIIVKDKETEKNEAILLDEWTGDWDRNYYWDVQVYAPIRRVLEAVWPEEDWSVYSIADAERAARKAEREEKKRIREEEAAAKKLANEEKKRLKTIDKEKKEAEMQLKREERKAKMLAKAEPVDESYKQGTLF